MAMDTDTRRAFLRALDEDEDFRQEVRQRLLSRELLELPEKFAAFTAYVNEFIAEQKQFNAEQRQFNAEVRQDIAELKEDVSGLKEDVSGLKEDVSGLKEDVSGLKEDVSGLKEDVSGLKEDVSGLKEDVSGLKEDVSGLKEDVSGLKEDVSGLKEDVSGLKEDVSGLKEDVSGLKEDVSGLKEDVSGLKEDVSGLKASYSRMEGQLNRLVDDVGFLKGNVASYAARDRFDLILEQLGLEYVNMLSHQELVAMVRAYGAERIDFSDRRSFYNADLILEAQDASGAACYVAVEASYTADQRDTDRVARNVEYLNRFTGLPAHGIIASVDNDHDIQPFFEAGTLHWFQLHQEDIQPQ